MSESLEEMNVSLEGRIGDNTTRGAVWGVVSVVVLSSTVASSCLDAACCAGFWNSLLAFSFLEKSGAYCFLHRVLNSPRQAQAFFVNLSRETNSRLLCVLRSCLSRSIKPASASSLSPR